MAATDEAEQKILVKDESSVLIDHPAYINSLSMAGMNGKNQTESF